MSSFTFADNKLGGRFTAAADAIASGKLRTAAGILNEIAGELNVEAESSDGLMSEDGGLEAQPIPPPAENGPSLTVSTGTAMDLQMCARNVHAYGAPDPISGWRQCEVCGTINVAPPDNNGPYDMSARQ